MKILFYRYGSICEPSISEAFHEYGLEVIELTEEIYNKNILPAERFRLINNIFSQNIISFVFGINFYPDISDLCNIYKIPYMCLIVDSPILELYSESIRNEYNRIFLFDKELYKEFNPYNPDRIFHIPLATNVTQWDKIISSDNTTQFMSEVSFVGSLYTEKNRLNIENTNKYLKGYIDALIESQLKIYGSYFIENCISDEIANDILSQINNSYVFPPNCRANNKALVAQYYIGNKITSEERVRLFKMLASKYKVDIYTGSNTTDIPQINNHGFAKTLTEMPLIFNRSAINLNITAKPIRSAIPLRVFDILGCGGFLISNYQSEISDYFIIGEHLEIYESFEDLDDKIHFYLEHPSIRKEIAQAGYEYVKNNHTYTIRIGQMINMAFK